MLKNTVIIAALFITALPANAESINWNKYRGSYISIQADDIVYSPTGFSLSASQMIVNDVFAAAEFTFVNDSAVIQDIATENDTTYFELDLGVKHTFKDLTDIYTSIGYETYRNDFIAEANSLSKDDTGYSLALGVRSIFWDHWEVHLSTTRITYSKESRWDNMISFAYHSNANLSWEFSFVKSKHTSKLIFGGAFGF